MKYSLMICLLVSLLACNSAGPSAQNPEIVATPADKLADLGEYVRAVKLEQTEQSTIGVVSEVEVAANGDLLVADFQSTERVLRFDAQGKFLNGYGKRGQGPGEYENLQGFTQFEDGRVVLMSNRRLMLFERDGTFLDGVVHSLGVHWLEAKDNRIYIYTTDGQKRLQNTVVVYDDTLERVDEFHPYDKRIDQVTIRPRHALTRSPDALYVSDFYHFRITAYRFDGSSIGAWQFPTEGTMREDMWRKDLNMNELKQLAHSLHRVHSVYALADRLVFTEVNFDRELFRLNILDPQNNQLIRYPRVGILAETDEGYLTMNDLVGANGTALIGTCEDSALFNKYRQQHPALTEVSFEDSDNPLLLFFDLKALAGTGGHS